MSKIQMAIVENKDDMSIVKIKTLLSQLKACFQNENGTCQKWE